MTQVEKSHYNHNAYQSPARYTSYFYQVAAVLKLEPKSLVDAGVGDGTFLNLARNQGISALGMDYDLSLKPSLCASILDIPLRDEVVDVFTAFQVLEHLPYEHLSVAVREMARVCRKGAVVSLPEFGNTSFVLNIPFVRHLAGTLPRWLPVAPKHRFDGQHYWEIGKRGFPLARILRTFAESGLHCQETWVNPYWAYHRFFVFVKKSTTNVENSSKISALL